MAKANPQTPDCAIRGCGKKARRLGMCLEHAALVPLDFSRRSYTAAQDAAQRAAAKVHREAQAHVRKVLRELKQAAR